MSSHRKNQAASLRRRTQANRQRQLETLEPRHLMAGDFRSIDGTGNNLANPEWGSTGEAFLRTVPAEYSDGISAPAGADRPSARVVSNLLAAHPEGSILSERDLSAFIYAWGQFIDHDIDLTPTSTPAEAFPIVVPTGDIWFDPAGTGTKSIGLSRSSFDATTGTSASNVRQQINAISALIDASMVYGSDEATAASLRTFVGGLLKTSEGNLLPTDANGFFLAGDIRVNENPDLLAMQTLFMREHNRLATEFAAAHPQWSDEELYQQARRIVAAEVQAITFNEFLPALLGKHAIRRYEGYDSTVNPGIANEFATAAFRLGHSLLGSDIEFLDNDGNEVREGLALKDAFFNAQVVREVGIDPILKYLASDRAEELDTRIVDDVRNFLFGPPGAGGFDLASLNIQRGRDHGLADYNAVRAAYGLPKVTDFAEITSDVDVQDALREAYGSVDNIDLWVGGLAEDHAAGASVGPLFQRIVADQFMRLRDGDRFWYERDLKGAELAAVRETSLADVIRRNTTTTNLQEDVFFFKPTVAGRVYLDVNGSGTSDRREVGISGIQVELHDAEGNVVATTRAQRDGHYALEAPELGTYTVHVVLPRGMSQTTAELEPLEITTGGRIEQVDLGLRMPRSGNPHDQPRPAPGGHEGRPIKPPPLVPPAPESAPRNAPPAKPTPPLPPPTMFDPQLVDAVFGGSTSNSGAGRPRR